MQSREQKGLLIARRCQIIKKDDATWIVPSQSGGRIYEVRYYGKDYTCTCTDYELRKQPCKHIYAVDVEMHNLPDKTAIVIAREEKRPTYQQNWHAYNTAQVREQELFMKLLADLCDDVEEPLYAGGRPRLSLRDMIFISALKIYSTFSLRRFMGDMKVALDNKYITRPCSFTSVGKYLQNEKLTPILHQLITLSAMPLKTVETKFAVDSTGLRTTRFTDYCREAHDMNMEHEWIKLHICTGTITNTITSAYVDFMHEGDSRLFIPLVAETKGNGFDVQEVSADKAYSGRDNLEYSVGIGAMPFIPFKNNATGTAKGSKVWRRMYNFFVYNQEAFLEHYHARSNVESTFFMIKSKFTDVIRSRNKTAQANEVLLKVLCHNIVVLIHEMHELGIKPNFIDV